MEPGLCILIGSLVIGVKCAIITLFCLTAGYIGNSSYNSEFFQTQCTYVRYNFSPYQYNDWDCNNCTGYYCAVITRTSNGIEWHTHQTTIQPPGRTVKGQTAYYQQRWPIGKTVTCYEAIMHDKSPIENLADALTSLYVGIAFGSLGGLCFIIAIIAGILQHRFKNRKQKEFLDQY